MSMSTEAVMKMAQELNESKEEVIPETETKEEIQPEVVETNDTTPENENVVSDEAPAQETAAESEEKAEIKESKPVKHTKEEQEKYAFTKLKNKERQKREKLISEYETRIKNLNDELARFKDLQKDNFKSDEEYVNYLVSRQMKEQESSQLQLEKANAENELFDEINEQRIMNCFPDEADRESYNKLIQTSAKPFVELLDKADPDNAILSYLDDSDISPLLIRVLMTKADFRNEILSKKSPYSKVIALDNLAKRLTYAKSIVDKKRSSANSQIEIKKPIPVVGKVAKSENSTSVDKNSPEYWNNMLRDLNSRRR